MTPTMIQFTLPFAGAFACVLVFSRLVADNEIAACRAGGMSYGLILLPALFLGGAFMLGMFLLSNWIVPRFFNAAEHTLEKDVTQMLVSQLQKGRPFELRDDLVVYASGAYVDDAPPHIEGAAVQPTRLIMLRGVAVGMLDDHHRMIGDATAEQADIYLFRDTQRDRSWLTLRLSNAQGYDAQRHRSIAFSEQPVYNIPVPSPFRDQPRFQGWLELRRLSREPIRYDKVADTSDRAARAIAREWILRSMVTTWRSGEGTPVRIMGPREGERYLVWAPRWSRAGDRLELSAQANQRVSIEYLTGGLISRRYEAASAEVEVRVGEPRTEPGIEIKLHDAHVVNERLEGRGTELSEWTMPAMHWPQPVLQPLARLTDVNVLRSTAARFATSRHVSMALERLDNQLRKLGRKIVAELHERAATAVGCLLIVLFASALSLLWRGQLPLVIYFWSFLVAAINVLIVQSGENLAQASRGPWIHGLVVLWTGAAVTAAAAAVMFAVLARR